MKIVVKNLENNKYYKGQCLYLEDPEYTSDVYKALIHRSEKELEQTEGILKDWDIIFQTIDVKGVK